MYKNTPTQSENAWCPFQSVFMFVLALFTEGFLLSTASLECFELEFCAAPFSWAKAQLFPLKNHQSPEVCLLKFMPFIHVKLADMRVIHSGRTMIVLPLDNRLDRLCFKRLAREHLAIGC